MARRFAADLVLDACRWLVSDEYTGSLEFKVTNPAGVLVKFTDVLVEEWLAFRALHGVETWTEYQALLDELAKVNDMITKLLANVADPANNADTAEAYLDKAIGLADRHGLDITAAWNAALDLRERREDELEHAECEAKVRRLFEESRDVGHAEAVVMLREASSLLRKCAPTVRKELDYRIYSQLQDRLLFRKREHAEQHPDHYLIHAWTTPATRKAAAYTFTCLAHRESDYPGCQEFVKEDERDRADILRYLENGKGELKEEVPAWKW
jgi:hypothetical protein